jgi:hypothetical protein
MLRRQRRTNLVRAIFWAIASLLPKVHIRKATDTVPLVSPTFQKPVHLRACTRRNRFGPSRSHATTSLLKVIFITISPAPSSLGRGAGTDVAGAEVGGISDQ